MTNMPPLPPDATDLAKLLWTPEGIALDRALAAAIWPAWQYPEYAGHTVSCILGLMENEGDEQAKEICDILAVLLGPGHCQRAVREET